MGIRNAMFNGLNRLANNIEQGKPPVTFSQAPTPIEQLDNSQDYLAMQTLFGMALRPPTIVKPEQYYPITAAGIPFVMNNSYFMSTANLAMKTPVHDVSMFSYKPNITSNNLYTNACGKNIAYPKVIPQTFTSPTQNIYPHSGNHIL